MSKLKIVALTASLALLLSACDKGDVEDVGGGVDVQATGGSALPGDPGTAEGSGVPGPTRIGPWEPTDAGDAAAPEVEATETPVDAPPSSGVEDASADPLADLEELEF